MFRVLVCAILLSGAFHARAYSVLTHEAIIDSAWERNLAPLLRSRFPNATAGDLTEAHAYAYGGCIIQDMGYYPFGSKFFSDLTHYVRTGIFIQALIRDSSDLNEYAFALGSLAHYAADNEGHSIAVNPSVAIEYPKLASKYGRIVTYADNPSAHNFLRSSTRSSVQFMVHRPWYPSSDSTESHPLRWPTHGSPSATLRPQTKKNCQPPEIPPHQIPYLDTATRCRINVR